jgi:sec-independent protein translocase protein TatA
MGLDNPLHIAFLVVILLLVFGARRLPELGRSLGSGMREFKQAISGETQQQPTLTASQQQPQAPAQAPVAEPAPPQPAPVPPQPAPVEPQHHG